jgi:hypothetical protein
MNKQDEIKMRFYTMVRDLLEKHQEHWTTFQLLWDAGEYRKAYLVLHEAVQHLRIELSEDYNGLDEEFYWYFIN